MTQADRDRLVTLQKAKKKLITQKDAAVELGITERQVRRLLFGLKKRGDGAVIHALRGQPSNRKADAELQRKAVALLSQEVYQGFGPTLAAEHLVREGIQVSRETARQWMMDAKLWRPRRQKVEQIHQWRQRRSRWGELVQWDTSDHAWLEGRGPKLKLILMIDDATSRWHARFVLHDSTEANMQVLEEYLREYGRPVAFYTDRAGLFQTAVKKKRDERGVDKDQPEMPPTQIGRALRELGIQWIAARSPQAKGRVERSFQTAQDRLVKEMRVAGVETLEGANQYLIQNFLPWCQQQLRVAPASPDNAHRALEPSHDLAAILSHVEGRQVASDYTFQFESKLYQIDRQDIRTGLRGGQVRVEKRRDGSLAVRFQERYLRIAECQPGGGQSKPKAAAAPDQAAAKPRTRSNWNKDFDLKKGPKTWQAAQASGIRSEGLS
jgi:CheY-like chemotaxis protein